MRFSKNNLVLLVILLIGGFLRFYNLLWGTPYFFHPDERNMAIAISQLVPPLFHPHFFAYGQFSLYLAYFSYQFSQLHFINFQTVPFESAVFWLRFYSALFSLATLLVFYLLSRKFLTPRISILATGTAAFLPGLIQAAHFGTTESILAFFFLLTIYLSLGLVEKISFNRILSTSFVLGLAIATKISSLIFIIVPVIALAFSVVAIHESPALNVITIPITNREQQSRPGLLCLKIFLQFILTIFVLSILTIIFSLIFSPHNLINFREFVSSINYESAVANGSTQVFYTRQFINTIPIIFQFQKIFPYALGIIITLLFPLGILSALIKREKSLFVVLIPFLIYFFFNAFLFAKWTRFLTPVFPLAVFLAFYLINIIKGRRTIAVITVILTMLAGVSFFSIYLKPDVRILASKWIYNNLPDKTNVLSETANVIDIPINDLDHLNKTFNVTSFNFYDLDQNKAVFEELLDKLLNSDYIFVPSRRIFINHSRLAGIYPKTASYYQALFDGSLGFTKVAEISSFPSLGPIQFNDEAAEETFTVFDHPVIRIYKKVHTYSREYYEELLIQ